MNPAAMETRVIIMCSCHEMLDLKYQNSQNNLCCDSLILITLTCTTHSP